MKILCIFIDMMGAEYMKLCNDRARQNEVDHFLSKRAGTVYRHCYTPAPDTPRSSACMWSGKYPKENLCNNRLKYPGQFLNRNISNFWEKLDEKGYQINIFIRKQQERIELIPVYGKEAIYNDSVQEFMTKASISENSFNFMYFPDLHTYLDDYHYTQTGLHKGTKYVAKLLDDIYSYYDAEKLFDAILIFSDHGFRMTSLKDHEHRIDCDRVQTFMYLYQKGENSLIFDDKIRSNLDVMPTICELIGCEVPECDGISLLDKNGHDYVLIEDHHDYSPSLGQTIEHWAVVTKDARLHWLECNGKWTDDRSLEGFNQDYFENLITDKMCDYAHNKYLYRILYMYRDNLHMESRYSDGKLHQKAGTGKWRNLYWTIVEYMYAFLRRLKG
jgi:hypothetical protein